MRRWWWLIPLALVLVLIGVLLLRWHGLPRISQESFDRIEHGMTRAEVQAILGPPAIGMLAAGREP